MCMCCGLFSYCVDQMQTHHTSIPTVIVSLMIHDNMYVYMFLCMYMCVYVFLWVYKSICVYVCVYVLCVFFVFFRTRKMVN